MLTLILALTFGSLVAVAIAEFFAPRQRAGSAARRRVGNLAIWLINTVLAALIFAPAGEARQQISEALGVSLPSWPTNAIGFVAGFLLLDFLRYLIHRWKHAAPLLWRIHALHHSDAALDVTTSVRSHPAEYLFNSAAFWLVALLIDLPASVAVAYGLAGFVLEAVQHGNIRLPRQLERWLQPVLVTVETHRIHHSIAFAPDGWNYATVLCVWDRIFGTFKRLDQAEQEGIVFGVRGLAAPVYLSAMISTPWRLGK